MDNPAKGSDRISIEESYHDVYKQLSEKSNQYPETAPFMLMKDVFMCAVAIGVKTGRRRPLSGGKEQIFRWDQFSQNNDVPTLQAIAIAETGDVEILLQEDNVLRIAEEYANEGIRVIKAELLNKAGGPLWNLVGILR